MWVFFLLQREMFYFLICAKSFAPVNGAVYNLWRLFSNAFLKNFLKHCLLITRSLWKELYHKIERLITFENIGAVMSLFFNFLLLEQLKLMLCGLNLLKASPEQAQIKFDYFFIEEIVNRWYDDKLRLHSTMSLIFLRVFSTLVRWFNWLILYGIKLFGT